MYIPTPLNKHIILVLPGDICPTIQSHPIHALRLCSLWQEAPMKTMSVLMRTEMTLKRNYHAKEAENSDPPIKLTQIMSLDLNCPL